MSQRRGPLFVVQLVSTLGAVLTSGYILGAVLRGASLAELEPPLGIAIAFMMLIIIAVQWERR